MAAHPHRYENEVMWKRQILGEGLDPGADPNDNQVSGPKTGQRGQPESNYSNFGGGEGSGGEGAAGAPDYDNIDHIGTAGAAATGAGECETGGDNDDGGGISEDSDDMYAVIDDEEDEGLAGANRDTVAVRGHESDAALNALAATGEGTNGHRACELNVSNDELLDIMMCVRRGSMSIDAAVRIAVRLTRCCCPTLVDHRHVRALQLGFALFLGARGGGSKLLLQRFNQLLLATPRSCWKLPP